MPEGRMLKKVISESKKLGALKSDSARLFYTWLLPHLDIEGRHSADLDILKGHIFPKVKSMTPSKIVRLLNELHDAKLIILYKANGETYLELKKFHDYQKVDRNKEAKSKIPHPTSVESGVALENSGVGQSNSPISKVKGSLSKDKVKESVTTILSYLNEKANRNFKTDSNDFISARFSDGYALDDFKKVIDVKIAKWLNDPKMSEFLRPSTLFRKTNFENYLNEKMPDELPKDKRGKDIDDWVNKPEEEN